MYVHKRSEFWGIYVSRKLEKNHHLKYPRHVEFSLVTDPESRISFLSDRTDEAKDCCWTGEKNGLKK